MAQIITNDDFKNACNWLIENGQLVTVGARFIDANNRVVIDENDNSDITPDTPTLEAALDNQLVIIQDQENLEQARITNRQLLAKRVRQELIKDTPNWNLMYTESKAIIDSDPELSKAMVNRLQVYEIGHSIIINEATNQGKAIYIHNMLSIVALYLGN